MKSIALLIPLMALALTGCDRASSKSNSLYSDAPGIQATPPDELTPNYTDQKRAQDGESDPVR